MEGDECSWVRHVQSGEGKCVYMDPQKLCMCVIQIPRCRRPVETTLCASKRKPLLS